MYKFILFFILMINSSVWSAAHAQHDPHKIFDDPEAYASLSRIIEQIEARDVQAIGSLLHSEFKESEAAIEELTQLLNAIPEGDLDFELFYAENRVGLGEYSGTPIYFAVYESKTSTGFVQLNLAVAPEESVCCVGTYINVIPAETRPSAYNDLTFAGKGWLHYLVSFAAASVFFLTVFTGIKCAFASDTDRKWLWVPFVLIGLWGVTFNWTTGELAPSFVSITETGFYFSFIQFKLFGVGVTTTAPFHPWTVEIGTPVGALIYWFLPGLRKKKTARLN